MPKMKTDKGAAAAREDHGHRPPAPASRHARRTYSRRKPSKRTRRLGREARLLACRRPSDTEVARSLSCTAAGLCGDARSVRSRS